MRGDQAASELDPLADAGVKVRVIQEHRAEGAKLRRAAANPSISLWSISGSSPTKHGVLAFSFSCVFQRYAIGAVRPAPAT